MHSKYPLHRTLSETLHPILLSSKHTLFFVLPSGHTLYSLDHYSPKEKERYLAPSSVRLH